MAAPGDPLFRELSLSVLFLLRSRLHRRWGRLQLPHFSGCSSLILIHHDSESDTEIPKRHVSPTTSTPEIPTSPILPALSVVVAPSSEFPLAPGIDHEEVGHSSLDHSSSRHSISGHFLPGHSPLDTTVADSYTPPRFVHPPLARTLRCSEAYLRWRSPTATVTSSIHAKRALVPSRADLLPPRKRFRDSISLEDSVKEDIDTDVLADIKVDDTVDEVAVDRDVKAGVDAGIGMEVDIGVDVEDEVEDEVESSDRGTMEVGVDVVARIDTPDGILMPDAVERLEHVEEGLQDIYDHEIGDIRGEAFGFSSMMLCMDFRLVVELIEVLAAYEATRAVNALEAESQSQNGSDGDNGNGGDGNGGNGNGENGNGENENPNENNRGARPVARECTYQDFMNCQPLNFKGTK
ncbi:hypothetical protein Tco_0319682 [Tanacetum coccineum]